LPSARGGANKPRQDRDRDQIGQRLERLHRYGVDAGQDRPLQTGLYRVGGREQ
jgi:hypothetical protein